LATLHYIAMPCITYTFRSLMYGMCEKSREKMEQKSNSFFLPRIPTFKTKLTNKAEQMTRELILSLSLSFSLLWLASTIVFFLSVLVLLALPSHHTWSSQSDTFSPFIVLKKKAVKWKKRVESKGTKNQKPSFQEKTEAESKRFEKRTKNAHGNMENNKTSFLYPF